MADDLNLTPAEKEMIQAMRKDGGARSADTVRPVFKREAARDENGLPQSVNQPKGEPKPAMNSRPTYIPPLRNPYLEPGAKPPNLNYYNAGGSWDMAEELLNQYKTNCDLLDKGKLSMADFQKLLQVVQPALSKKLWLEIPEKDCDWTDCPFSPGNWKSQVTSVTIAFDPDPALANSIGTMETRRAPILRLWADTLDGWVFRFRPPAHNTKKKPAKINDLA